MHGRVLTPLDMSHVLSTERTSVPYALLSFINIVSLLWLIQGTQGSTLFMPVISCPGQEIENVTGLQCAGSDPGLKPHCVPRDEDGQLGLVCTLWIWLGTDICPAYSEKHQQIVYRTCKGNESECPSDGQYHKSFEAYEYKGCIPDMTKSSGSMVGLEASSLNQNVLSSVQKSQETPDGTNVKNTTTRGQNHTRLNENGIYIAIIAILISVLVITSIVIIVWKERKSMKARFCYHQSSNNQTEKDSAEPVTSSDLSDTIIKPSKVMPDKYNTEAGPTTEPIKVMSCEVDIEETEFNALLCNTKADIEGEWRRLTELGQCTSCGTNRRNILCLDCHHLLICDTCSPSVEACRKCNSKNKNRMKVFWG